MLYKTNGRKKLCCSRVFAMRFGGYSMIAARRIANLEKKIMKIAMLAAGNCHAISTKNG